MTLEQIKAAVLAGKTVHWSSEAYEVRHSAQSGKWIIVCLINNDVIGLTWLDGVTMNGKPEQFYIAQ